MNIQSLRQFIANELNESLGNLNKITDSTVKQHVKEVLKFMKGQLYANGFSPNSEISKEISCKTGDVIAELKRRSSAGGIAGVVVKANQNVGIVIFDAGDRIASNTYIRLFGGHKGYNASNSPVVTLGAALKYFHETSTTKVKQADVKTADVNIIIVYADKDTEEKVINRRENKNTRDKYATDGGDETRFMRQARVDANNKRLLKQNKNLSTKDPLLYSKLLELYDASETLVGPDLVIDGVEYSQLRIPNRYPPLEVINKIPQITLATFINYKVILSPSGFKIVKR